LLSLNIQSLPSKFNEFEDMISLLAESDVNPDIICLQETWQVYDQSMYVLQGYHPPLFKLRNNNTQGGGVGIYVKSNLFVKLLPNYSIFTEKIIETIFVEVTTSVKKKIIVGSIYRSNSKFTSLTENQQFLHFSDTLSNILADLSELKQEVYIYGDFNIDLFKYPNNILLLITLNLSFLMAFFKQ
jgi:exonuclease III